MRAPPQSVLAAEAEKAGLVHSLAYADQPALIWELVDWARTSAFKVTAAGKGGGADRRDLPPGG